MTKSKFSFGLLLAVCVSPSLFAINYLGNVTLHPGEVNDSVYAIANVTLSTPGTYRFEHFKITGNLLLAEEGVYRLETEPGTFVMLGNVLGPGGGTTLQLKPGYSFLGSAFGTVLSPYGQIPGPGVSTDPFAPLLNMSVQLHINAGDVAQTGFVIGGSRSRTVLIRAIGPGLGGFNVTPLLNDPNLVVQREGQEIASNDDWSSSNTPYFEAVGAFPLVSGSRDAAVVLTLQPGLYTASVSGGTSTDAGRVIIEFYYVS